MTKEIKQSIISLAVTADQQYAMSHGGSHGGNHDDHEPTIQLLFPFLPLVTLPLSH